MVTATQDDSVVLTTEQNIYAKGCIGVDEAAARYAIPRSTIYELIREGRLSTSKVKKRRLIPVVAMERMLQESEIGLPTPVAIPAHAST